MPWTAVLLLAVPLTVAAGLVTIMVAVASKPGGPAAIVVLSIGAVVVLPIAAFLVSVMRPVTLTPSVLRIPPSGFKTVVIPLDDVAGVGLRFHSARLFWYAYVWRRDGSAQRINGLVCRKGAYAPSSQIAASRAARTVRRLDAKVRAMQGPAGSLATLELQKHAPTGLTDDVGRFWSPDGYTGDIDSSLDQPNG